MTSPVGPRSGSSAHDTGDTSSALDILRAAPRVTIHTVGFAAAKPPEMLAYVRLKSAGGAVRRELDELLRTGSPSGRVYAALLLEATEAEAGRTAWMSLRDDNDSTAIHCGGCTPHYPTTVGAFASAVLASGGAASAMTVRGVPSWSRPPAASS